MAVRRLASCGLGGGDIGCGEGGGLDGKGGSCFSLWVACALGAFSMMPFTDRFCLCVWYKSHIGSIENGLSSLLRDIGLEEDIVR